MATRSPALTAQPNPERFRAGKDMTGQTVRIPENPRHILSLCTSATDTIIRLGRADCLSAVDEYNRVIPGTQNARVIGNGSALSQEQIIVLKIDLAFVWWYQDDAADLLRNLGIPAVRIRVGRTNEVPEMIRVVGNCLNAEPAASRLAGKVEKDLRRLSGGTKYQPHPRIYLELYSPYKTIGKNTYLNDLIELSGGQNIAATASGSMLLSSEHLMKADPEIIIFEREYQSANAIRIRPGLSGINAIRTGKIFSIESYDLVAGAGFPQTVSKLQKIFAGSIRPGG